MNFVSYVAKTALGAVSTLIGIAILAIAFWWGTDMSLFTKGFLYFLGALFGFTGPYLFVCAGREYDDYLERNDEIVDYS